MMRKIGAYAAIGALATALLSAPPAQAFGLHLGPFHIGLPFPWHPRSLHRPLYMRADPNELTRREAERGTTQALLYTDLALAAIFQNIFWPAYASPWPFGYRDIFATAFAKPRPARDARLCQQTDGADTIVDRIQSAIAPTAEQSQLLQRLGGALNAAAGFLAKSCPNDIPAQPTARLKLMESQIEELTMAVDMIRQPLQDFEQSLDDEQKARFAIMIETPGDADRTDRSATIAQSCGSPTAIDWSIDKIDRSVQPSDDQRDALAMVKQSLGSVISDLEAHCPVAVPSTALARLETIEARLDASWRAVLSIQVTLANFESHLSAEQKDRFDNMDLASR